MKSINIWAVLVSSVVSTMFGFLWYMVLFTKPYVEGLGRTKEQMDQGPNGLTASIMQVVGNIALAYVLAWLMNGTDNTSIGPAIKLAIIIWIGFVAAVIGPMYAFQAFSFQFFLINTVYTLITLIISALILSVWR